MKYVTHYRGYMIFKKENGYYCPSINEDLNCKSVNDAQRHIDAFFTSKPINKIKLPFTFRHILLKGPYQN
jgi:hypothetical protein